MIIDSAYFKEYDFFQDKKMNKVISRSF